MHVFPLARHPLDTWLLCWVGATPDMRCNIWLGWHWPPIGIMAGMGQLTDAAEPGGMPSTLCQCMRWRYVSARAEHTRANGGGVAASANVTKRTPRRRRSCCEHAALNQPHPSEPPRPPRSRSLSLSLSHSRPKCPKGRRQGRSSEHARVRARAWLTRGRREADGCTRSYRTSLFQLSRDAGSVWRRLCLSLPAVAVSMCVQHVT